MKLYETKKLYYGKYLYKLVVTSTLAYSFRTEFQKDGRLDYARLKLEEISKHYDRKSNTTVIQLPTDFRRYPDEISVNDYLNAKTLYYYLRTKSDYRIRCESYQVIIFSNDRQMLITLNNKLFNTYIEFWEPNPTNIDTLLTGDNIIIVDKKPDYEYKITFGNKKGKGTAALAKWIDANPSLAKMTSYTKHYCKSGYGLGGMYFYAKNKKALFMIQMIVSDNIQRVDKLIYTAE